jgi:hypothetical protein
MTGIETLLVIVVVCLGLLLFVVGFQVLMIILDLRKSIKRMNSILEDAILGGGLIQTDKLANVLSMFRKKKGV